MMVHQDLRLQEVVNTLHQLSKENSMKFILITKDSNPNSEIKCQHSSQYNLDQVEEIKDILGRATLTTIKPTLSQMRLLKLYKNQHPTTLIKQYRDLFNSLSQVVCKEVAKSWIKIIEPFKQALFPYRDFNKTKPSWWPQHVNHIEPDHLDKFGRVEVLINILRHPQFDLKEVDLRSYNKRPVIQSFLREILYLAIYDRMYYNMLREEDALFQLIPEHERDLFEQSSIMIMTSDMRIKGTQELIMTSKVKDVHLNHRIFGLNQVELYPTADFAKTLISTTGNKTGKIVKTKSKSNLRSSSRDKKPTTRSSVKIDELVLKSVERRNYSSSPIAKDNELQQQQQQSQQQKFIATEKKLAMNNLKMSVGNVQEQTYKPVLEFEKVTKQYKLEDSDDTRIMEQKLTDVSKATKKNHTPSDLTGKELNNVRMCEYEYFKNSLVKPNQFNNVNNLEMVYHQKDSSLEDSGISSNPKSSPYVNFDGYNEETGHLLNTLCYYDDYESSSEEETSAFEISSSSDDFFEHFKKVDGNDIATFDEYTFDAMALHL